jgi:hypothetical protein
VREKKAQTPQPISDQRRESDNLLRRELAQSDPEKFKRLLKPLFRSSRIEEKTE